MLFDMKLNITGLLQSQLYTLSIKIIHAETHGYIMIAITSTLNDCYKFVPLAEQRPTVPSQTNASDEDTSPLSSEHDKNGMLCYCHF